jgi:predicted neuraminidase
MSAAWRWFLTLLALGLSGWGWIRGGAVKPPPVALQAPGRSLPNQEQPFFEEEFIEPTAVQPMSHAASICELGDGRLAAAWYAGSREGAKDVAIYFATRPAGSQGAWSAPQPIVTRETASQELRRYVRKLGNAVLFSGENGKVWLLYVTVAAGGWSGSSLNLRASSDHGRTWSKSERLILSPFFNVSELARNKPVALEADGWLVPIYHECAGKFPELLWLREDGAGFRATKTRLTGGRAFLQPALVPLSSQSVLAFLRDASPARGMVMAASSNAGLTWSEPRPAGLPNPNAGLDALRLPDGRVLVVFNDSRTDRSNLRLAFSSDEGRTWKRAATLAEEAGAEFSYPFVMQGGDGLFHVVYTWKRQAIRHAAFNLAWLDAQARKASPALARGDGSVE